MVTLRATHPDLYKEYQSSRIIIDRRGSGSNSNDNGGNNGGNPGGGSPDTSARIAGQVTSMADGSPIGDAEVRAYTVADGPTGPAIGTTTDALGRYVILIPELPQQEEVVIEAMATGFLNQERNLLIGPGQTFDDENLSMMPA
jgi:hypothetical protein